MCSCERNQPPFRGYPCAPVHPPKGVPTWFRIPLIKDFNDSEADFKKVVEMALELGVEKISLLPYHEGGKVKTHQIGLAYRMDRAAASSEDHIQYLIDIAAQMGVACTAGK